MSPLKALSNYTLIMWNITELLTLLKAGFKESASGHCSASSKLMLNAVTQRSRINTALSAKLRQKYIPPALFDVVLLSSINVVLILECLALDHIYFAISVLDDWDFSGTAYCPYKSTHKHISHLPRCKFPLSTHQRHQLHAWEHHGSNCETTWL